MVQNKAKVFFSRGDYCSCVSKNKEFSYTHALTRERLSVVVFNVVIIGVKTFNYQGWSHIK